MVAADVLLPSSLSLLSRNTVPKKCHYIFNNIYSLKSAKIYHLLFFVPRHDPIMGARVCEPFFFLFELKHYTHAHFFVDMF